jgi:hypothetical protein
MHFVFLNVILLYNSHPHVSDTHVTIVRVVSARIQIFLDHCTVKIIQFWLNF